MDSKLLSAFIKLYEKRSLRQAALDLYITPQGLSRTLQNLENELDVILFDRTTQGLHPTEAGDYLYSHAKEMLQSYTQMRLNLQTLGGHNKDLLFICSYGAMNALPYEKYLHFQEQHPDYHISWREYPDKSAEQIFSNEEYELALLVSDTLNNQENYESTLLFSRKIMLLVYKDHPLYDKEVIDFSDLRNEKIIMEGNDFWINEAFREKCISHGFCPNIIIETGDISFCHKLCSMRQGLSITVDFIADFINTPEVHAIPFSDSTFLWNVYLFCNKKRVLSPAAKQFCSFLKENYRDK